MAQAKSTKKADDADVPEAEQPAEDQEQRQDDQDRSFDDQDESDDDDGQDSGGRQKKKVLTAKGAIRRSIEQLEELTGRAPESVIAVEREDDGWKVSLELVETRRIPDTADILAEYSAHIDDRGELASYRRESRYTRGRVDG